MLCNISLSDIKAKSPRWRFNVSLLSNQTFIISLKENRWNLSYIGLGKIFFFFFVINSFLFLFFSHITQHNIQNITKQNNRHILNISRSNQKGGREGMTIKTQKSLLYTITYIHQKTLPSINGRGPGPTYSRRCTFT